MKNAPLSKGDPTKGYVKSDTVQWEMKGKFPFKQRSSHIRTLATATFSMGGAAILCSAGRRTLLMDSMKYCLMLGQLATSAGSVSWNTCTVAMGRSLREYTGTASGEYPSMDTWHRESKCLTAGHITAVIPAVEKQTPGEYSSPCECKASLCGTVFAKSIHNTMKNISLTCSLRKASYHMFLQNLEHTLFATEQRCP